MSAKDLDLALILSMVDKISAPARKVTGVTGRMAQAMGQSKKELAQLSQQAKRVQALQGLNRNLGDSSEKLNQARANFKRLRGEFAKSQKEGKDLKALRKQLDSAAAAVSKVSGQHNALRKKVGAARKQLKEAGIDTRNLSQAQDQLGRKTDQLNRKYGKQRRALQLLNRAGDKARKILGGIKRAAKFGLGVGLAGILGFGTASASVINKGSQIEDFRVAIEQAMGGDLNKANEATKWIKDFTATTPFNLEQVTKAFLNLKSTGLEPTNGLLKTLGDTASGNIGKTLDDTVQAVMDATTNGFERLKELGVVASQSGDLVTFSFANLKGERKELSALKDDKEQVIKVLSSIWDDKFSGLMERRSKNWSGLWSNMGDQLSNFIGLVAESGPLEKMKEGLSDVLGKINEMSKNGELKAWSERVGGAMVKVIDGIRGIATATVDAVKAGKAMIDGIGQGIDEKILWITGRFEALGDAMPEWVQKVLKINTQNGRFTPSSTQFIQGGMVPASFGSGGSLHIGEINIHTQPGQDATAIALEVKRQIARLMHAQGVQQRSSYSDIEV